jgi:hypothetical protein
MSEMRRLVLVALATSLLVGANAAAAANPVLSAIERTAKARSSKVEIEATTSVPGTTIVMHGGGTTRGTSVAMSLYTSGSGQSFTMDVVGLRERGAYVMYMRSPVFAGQLPPEKSWLRIDLQRAANQLGVDLSSVMSSSRTLAPLEHGLVSTTRVGFERVAGKPTTHYRAVIDIARAAAAVPAYGAQVAKIERALGIHFGRQTQHIWVGRDGRVRRYSFTMPTGTRTARGAAVQTMTFLAYDIPVAIAAPPKSLVFDFPG